MVDRPSINADALSLTALAAMTREQVDALDEDARERRRLRLLDDPTPWGIGEIAAAAGVEYASVASWRWKYLRTGQVTAEALIAPDPKLSGGPLRKPKEPGRGRRSGDARPKWRAGKVRAWLNWTERMDADFFPVPGGRKPPGRPPAATS